MDSNVAEAGDFLPRNFRRLSACRFIQSPRRFPDDGMFLQDRALRQLGEKSDFIHAGRESLDRLDGIEHVGQIGPITPHG